MSGIELTLPVQPLPPLAAPGTPAHGGTTPDAGRITDVRCANRP
ncbi:MULTISPECIES: hypothetical protein [Micromonospora]|uniref:Uncharacterized protein n=1 Tax=Micromonospora rubida TaxID=2697657 RepID=A0ABW7SXW6_9ACTN|nr:hypothetical protein [Micromonospora rubida]